MRKRQPSTESMCSRLFFRLEGGLSMPYIDCQGSDVVNVVSPGDRATGDQAPVGDDIQRIYYEITGQGPALVLLHSLGFNSDAWREQVRVLSPYYTVITPDIRGHGRSPYQKTITVNGVVDDVEALLNHLSIDRYHVLGISMGGIFALSYYRRNPQ